MMGYLGDFPVNGMVYVMFNTFNGSGASVTLTGLAVTDIEIYKDGSTTQRSSDAGYTLLDTDGIDFDGVTGIHGFKIDLSDNTDAGFYAAGHEYTVVISSVTIDSQTVNFVAAEFSIERSGGALALIKSRLPDALSAGGNIKAIISEQDITPNVNVVQLGGVSYEEGAIPAAAAGGVGGLAIVGSSMDVGSISGDSAAADNFETMLDGTGGNELSLGMLHIVASGNNSAINVAGSGTGHGIVAQGGASDGVGIYGYGQGTAPGLLGYGSGSGGDGIKGLGTGDGAGILASAGLTGAAIETTKIIGTHLSAGLVAELIAAIESSLNDAINVDILPDTTPALGDRPTLGEGILMITRILTEKSVVGARVYVEDENGSTVMEFNLNNSKRPTSITRAV